MSEREKIQCFLSLNPPEFFYPVLFIHVIFSESLEKAY